MHSNPFWRYSLVVYQRSTVSDRLLSLQDRFGFDVNMVLCCCWLGVSGHVLAQSQAKQLMTHCRQRRENCLLPLRSIRRYLITQPSANELYEQTKALELEAERWQQDLIYQWLQEAALGASELTSSAQILDNLRVYTGCMPSLAWRQVETLLRELVICLEGD